jgi:membrane protein implicated in regulation of membrane protease activity
MFLVALFFQAVAGHADYNNDERAHAQLSGDRPDTISLGRYVVSSQFGNAVMENWPSEYLQFALFALLTVWLVQRGSPESKELDKAGRESDADQLIGSYARADSPRWARAGGWRTRIYENSLLLVMGAIFLASWFAQSVTGRLVYNAEQLEHEQATVSWLDYVASADFWQATLENWQSEFLAVGSFAVLTIYLRQRGSPESKPVGEAHDSTGITG